MTPFASRLRRLRARLAEQAGFTMVLAMGVMLMTTLLVGATYVALDGDAHLTQSDQDAKSAYYAARAGMQVFLYDINQNSSYWQTCSNDSTNGWVSMPGSTSGEQYSYAPVPANGYSACSTSNVLASMIDTNSGELSMKFYGKAGNATRGIVVSFRRASPLDYLYYTVYEALDSSVSGYSYCAVWYRQGRNSNCNIYWFSGDSVNGPLYTQDQLLIESGNSPTFGRSSADTIATLATGSICSAGCQNANFKGTVETGISDPAPTSNSALATDAANYGKVFTGTTTITLNGGTATAVNCPTSTTCTTTTLNPAPPIIYVQSGSGCTSSYTPFGASYPSYGPCGDVYVSGNYTSSMTLAAANNIIITGAITTTTTSGLPSGNAVLGLIANKFVRVQHEVPSRPATFGSCPSGNDIIDLKNLTIDAAILALNDSFIVDNFDCDMPQSTTPALGTLTVNGSIVQKFRGAVGTGGTYATGYQKNYNYDSRLAYLAPPYLFDLLSAAWKPARETLCVPNGTSAATAC
jgi:hypothetical protein